MLSQRVAGSSERRARPKRKMPSLSINNPMEVLRQRLMLEVARKQMREASQRQAVANRVFLQNVGKRVVAWVSRYGNTVLPSTDTARHGTARHEAAAARRRHCCGGGARVGASDVPIPNYK
ncbi:hypothetical protein MSG28_000404 [Choristoneura fumiferana]|uniref:Uncharacterized protein n=1 Tax=Choristoneura fumiferana TaxID=7141 RepID=A0ACC0K170_CHOFU|nr:hypothetical protein MSG28_000404 [Choristoneura fumiferana]